MKHSRWVLPGLAVLAIGTAAVIALAQPEEPDALRDLQRAQEAGERAGSASDQIVANLERIESNLHAGVGLSEKTDQIHDLTERQGKSLENLADLLRDQLNVLRETTESLEGTHTSARGIGRLGAEQLAILNRTLGHLRELRSSAAYATRTSGELARLAIYGARLAEDSQKRFSR